MCTRYDWSDKIPAPIEKSRTSVKSAIASDTQSRSTIHRKKRNREQYGTRSEYTYITSRYSKPDGRKAETERQRIRVV